MAAMQPAAGQGKGTAMERARCGHRNVVLAAHSAGTGNVTDRTVSTSYADAPLCGNINWSIDKYRRYLSIYIYIDTLYRYIYI